MLKEFRGHISYVNSAIYLNDEQRLVSCSSDGAVKIWDVKSNECVKTFTFSTQTIASPLLKCMLVNGTSTVAAASASSSGSERLLVLERSSTLRMINLDGTIIQTFISTSTGASASLAHQANIPLTNSKDKDKLIIKPAVRSKTQNTKQHKSKQKHSPHLAFIQLFSLPLIFCCHSHFTHSAFSTLFFFYFFFFSAKMNDSSGAVNANDFVACCSSWRGSYIYAITEECILHIFSATNTNTHQQGQLLSAIKLHKGLNELDNTGMMLGLIAHPYRNILASYAMDSTMKIWKP